MDWREEPYVFKGKDHHDFLVAPVNQKHARLLRQAQHHYIAKIAAATPGNMEPDYQNIAQAGRTLAGLVHKVWPTLNHRGRGKASALLHTAARTGATFNLSDVCARLLRA